MTRINSAIKVCLLTDEHLLAEHREIKRLPFVYKKRLEAKKHFSDVPIEFTLGKGHVLFFINKSTFTLNRYIEIYDECLKRGFEVEDYRSNWIVYKEHNDYIVTKKEYTILVDRIEDRLLNTKKDFWHYYGKKMSKTDAVNLLKSV